jgi:hypothetical protein
MSQVSTFDEQTQLMTPLTSPEHLNAWTKKFCGFTLPDCKVTKYADCTPRDFVWEVYRAMMDGKALDIMGLAGRDGSKTAGLSVIDFLALVHDQRSALHAGMIQAQASRAREYLQKYIFGNGITRAMVTKENTKNLELLVNGEPCNLELISLTPKSVQGAHYALVSVDELASSMDAQQRKAYMDLAGVPGTSRKGKPAIKIRITSRQAAYTLAEKDIDESPKTGMKIRKWTTIDCMKKCPEDRSGTVPSPRYINVMKGDSMTPSEYQSLPPERRVDFELAEDVMDGCLKCPLLVYCQGRARFQTSDSVLLRDIDDVIGKVFNSGSHEWALSQLLSLRPAPESLVYSEFNLLTHMPPWEFLWEKLTGEKPDREIGRSDMIRELKRRGCGFYCGMDFGWTNPSTAVVIALDRKDNVYVVEATGKTHTNDPDWVDFVVRNLHARYDIQMYMPDPENKSACDLMRKAGLPVAEIDKGPGSVRAGINTVKGYLKVPGTTDSKLFFFPDIPVKSGTSIPCMIQELGLYSRETDVTGRIMDDKNPVKENDHYLDGLRYCMYWLFGKSQLKIGTDYLDEKPFVPVSGAHNIPSLEQIARQHGLLFTDNREEYSRQQKTEPDDESGGGGLISGWT